MNVISRSELLQLHNDLGIKARALMVDKNHDYAVESDVFRNFRTFGTLGVLVRLSDKLARLRSFEENQVFKVTDEKLIDTILDTINYAVIYYAMKQEGINPVPTPPTTPVSNVISIDSGPHCSFGCGRLADYRKDWGGVVEYYCSDCAVWHSVDTSDMTLLAQVV